MNPSSAKRDEFACAALHLGGVDFYCALGDFPEPDQFRAALEKIWSKFPTASLPAIIRIVQEEFGRDEFGLEDILPDGRLAICEMIFNDMLEGFTDRVRSPVRGVQSRRRNAAGLGLRTAAAISTAYRVHARTPLRTRDIQRSTAATIRSHTAKRSTSPSEARKRGYQIDKSAANESFAAMINDVVAKRSSGPSRVSHQCGARSDRAVAPARAGAQFGAGAGANLRGVYGRRSARRSARATRRCGRPRAFGGAPA